MKCTLPVPHLHCEEGPVNKQEADSVVEKIAVKNLSTGNYRSGNSQLLIEYREALIRAYKLGEDIKELYGVVPPKVLYDADFVNTTHRDPKGYPMIHISLQVN